MMKLAALAAAAACLIALSGTPALAEDAPAAAGAMKPAHDAARHPNSRFRHHHRGHAHHNPASATEAAPAH